jgi:exodeoxyribonuclease-5
VKIVLTEDQEGALLAIKSFLLDADQKEFVLSGNSGSGKSTLIKYLLLNLEEFLKPAQLLLGEPLTLRPYLTATTNEAATVLSNSTGEVASTVHKAFKMHFKQNYQTGKLDLMTTNAQKLWNSLVVVDEASMCNTLLRRAINEHTCEKSKILYVGDNQQLAAVNSKCDIFTSGLSGAHLTTNVRQAGNEIAALGLRFKDAVIDGNMPELDGVSTEHIKYVNGAEFKELVENRFHIDNYIGDRRILAYHNSTVIEYNDFIRELQNGFIGYREDEYLVTNNTISKGETTIAKNNEEVQINSISRTSDYLGMEGHTMDVIGSGGVTTGFVPDNPRQAKRIINQYKKDKDWSNMFKVQDYILDLRPRFASTVHKAQGGTLSEVYIDLNDIGSSNAGVRGKARALYVAITRAKDRVYLYGSL